MMSIEPSLFSRLDFGPPAALLPTEEAVFATVCFVRVCEEPCHARISAIKSNDKQAHLTTEHATCVVD